MYFTREENNSQVANMMFDNTIKLFYTMVFTINQEKNETYTFNYIMIEKYCQKLIDVRMVQVNANEYRDHWTLVKVLKVPTDHYVNGLLSTILEIWSFRSKMFPNGRLLKHKVRLCFHGVIHKLGVNYWETYAPVVIWIRF